ncbi:hypothetical protein A6E13_15765 [Aliivibrio fischeri]|uniref:hypothetical protein n=1 Tax=Aliivibrio fischeri TaxID=668 RepID=UPI00080EB136|nr:hypothetical protein [Aliivibrio fischeri]OCH32029.1 hypothetical protein A6E13_15765 [Aliivibrio fischeri]
MNLKKEIIQRAKEKNIDPYKEPFRPSCLSINSSKYGSFSDYCSKEDTCSGKWNDNIFLKAVEFNNGGRPVKYILLK